MSINLFDTKSATQEQLKLYLDGSPNNSPIKEKRQKELLDSIFIVSKKNNLNPIYILAHCIHESDWCRSKISIDKNNLFGFGAYNSDPYNSAKTFKNYNECIDYVMNYIKLNYLTKGGLYYVDDTLEGMNKYYASDKNWSIKITNIYNEIVKFINTLPKSITVIQKPKITISNIEMNEMNPLECKYLFVNTLTNKLYTFSGEKGKEILLLDLSEEGKLKARWLNENPLNNNQNIPIIDKKNKIQLVLDLCEQERLFNGSDFKEIDGENDGPQVRKYLSFVGLNNPEPWCAAFVSWVLNQNSINFVKSGDTWEFESFAEKNNILFDTPEPGDVFLLYGSDNRPTHTGFVKTIDPSNTQYILTIEGNISNSIKNCNDTLIKDCKFIRWNNNK